MAVRPRTRVGILEVALQAARERNIELVRKLAAQVAAPFTYGTVLAVIQKLQPKSTVATGLNESGLAPLPKREGFGDTFVTTKNEPVMRNQEVQGLDEFLVGDSCVLKSDVATVPVIANSKSFVIMGFTNDNKVITQLDNKLVVIHTPSEHRELFDLLSAEVSATVAEGEMEEVTWAVLVFEGRILEALVPKGMELTPGETVALNMKSLTIVSRALLQMSGEIAVVQRVIDDSTAEIVFHNSTKVVLSGRFAKELEKGDQVVLDSSGVVITNNLGKNDQRFSVSTTSNVTWNDIGGLEKAKEDLIEAVELPHRCRRLFGFYDQKTVKGILLYGPPGCGKTLLGKAVANAMARIYNDGKPSEGFIYVKGPEILEKYVGVAEANVRQLFDRARKHKAKYGYPAVILIDEAEAILATRDSGISSDVGRTIVPAFLNEMDGLDESCAIVMLATNRPDMLDSAVVRDGRIDLKIMVTRPTPESAKEIFLRNLRNKPLASGLVMEDLAAFGSQEFFSPNRGLYEIRKRSGGIVHFTLKEILNGAMIANAVNLAVKFALRRDLAKMSEAGASDDDFEKFCTGLTKEDLLAAIDLVQQQTRDLNFKDDLEQFVHDFMDDVDSIETLRQGRG